MECSGGELYATLTRQPSSCDEGSFAFFAAFLRRQELLLSGNGGRAISTVGAASVAVLYEQTSVERQERRD
jgi:hypothetical protein